MKGRSDPEDVLIRFFGSTSRARILTLLFGNEELSFYQRQIMFESGLSLQTVQRELRNLVEIGIVSKHEADNRVYYQVNGHSSFFNALKEICRLMGSK